MKKHLGILLAFALIFNTSSAFAKASVLVSADPKEEKIKINASFDNEGKISVNVFNANFTKNAVSEQKYDDTTFKKDFDEFVVSSDVNKKASIDYIKQLDNSGKSVDLTYKSTGEKGRYVVFVTNEAGESAYKYFTYIKEADYPSVLSEFNALESKDKVADFLDYYEEVFFTNPGYDSLSDTSKDLISKELFDTKSKESYISMDDVASDYTLNANVLKFYEFTDTDDAVKFLTDNAQLLKISSIDNTFASANDTYKANVAEYIRKQGAKCYTDWSEVFKDAAAEYAPKTSYTPSSGGGGSSSKGGTASFVASNDVLNTTTTSSEAIYTDIDLSHWAYESVLRLTQRGVVSGDGNKNFRPNDYVTRAEFLKMILTSMELYDASSVCTFNDVEKNDWFYAYVASAQANEIALGDTNGNFNPNAKISRQDAVKIMHNAAMFKNYAIKEAREYLEFTDEADIASYALVAIKTMYCANVINGYEDKSFKPTASITRAEAAKMTFSFLQSVN